MRYEKTGALRETRRELDLRTGVARSVHVLADGSRVTQEVFAGKEAVVVVVTADEPVGLAVSMDGAAVEGRDLVKRGVADGEGATRFVCRARALQGQGGAAGGGEGGKALVIPPARKIVLALSVATDFDRKKAGAKLPDGWEKKAGNDLDALAGKSAEQLREAAVAAHRRYFDRLEVDFGKTAGEVLALPTRKRLERIRQGKHDDPGLVEDYFQFGRYLLIASSRPGAFPANLQGLWNPHRQAPWGSDYHLNINLQMNYWLAETANLPEMHRPLFDLIRFYQPTGKEMARRMGMKGWCMGHASDLWGHARVMSRTAFWGGSFFGGQWMTFHVLDHYRFSRDKDFLRENWDVLTASAGFVDSWLIPGPGKGELMARPSCSPENSFIYQGADGNPRRAALSAGNTFDQFMVLQVFHDYLEAAEALGKTGDPFVRKIKATLPKVYRPRIAGDGRLMEWRLPFKEGEPGHRHMSHLLGAYPGNQVNLDDDPAMRSAVLKSLEGRLRKGGAGTGWSRAWTIGLYARLSDPAKAYENLHAILARSTLDNLFDSHPPFQIDGNFGAAAAIAEMLLHSHNGEIKLLPALPARRWPDGHARGLRARGDCTVDVRWEGGKLVQATLHTGKNADGKPLRVVYAGKTTEINLVPGESVTLDVDAFGW